MKMRPQTGGSDPGREEKLCEACGRPITWRRKWAECWAAIRYCSSACRRRRISATDRALESAILTLLQGRAREASICPSEAARRVAGATDSNWRTLMEPTRRAARRLAARNQIEILQRGHPVDPARMRGPIRLRRIRPA